MKKFLPDWSNPRALWLVLPYNLYSPNIRTPREILMDFFFYFLDILDRNEENLIIKIIVQEDTPNSILEKIKNEIKNNKVIFDFIYCHDIWIRDWAPLPLFKEENNKKLSYYMKTIYNPDYCPYRQEGDNKAGEQILNKITSYIEDKDNIPLKWDGGNITTNGSEIIVTNKLFQANPSLNIEEEFEKLNIQVDKIITVPIEDNFDNIGHIDAICRFIDESTVVIPSYDLTDFKEEQKYIESVKKSIQEQAPHLKIISIPSHLSDEMNKEEIYSAEGTYVNFLRLGDNIYIPQYNLYEDEEAFLAFKRHFRSKPVNIIPVSGDISKLAYLGGALNCFSFVEFYWS